MTGDTRDRKTRRRHPRKFVARPAHAQRETGGAESSLSVLTAALGRAEAALRERDRDLRSILDHMPAMIGYWGRDQRNRFGNFAYREWFGIEPAEMPGMHIRDVIGEERYRLNLPHIEAALRGEPQLFERAIPSPDGSVVRHSLAHYIPDTVDGAVRGFYVLVSDVTALKEASAALSASEARYRAVVENQTEVIARIAIDGTFIFANDVFCRFFGKSVAELVGKKWMPNCYADDVPVVEALLRTLSPGNDTVVIENRVYAGSGALHWMQFVNRGFFDAAGRLVEIQSVGRDITERKNMEAALHEARLQLEQRVVERTEQLRRVTIEATLAEERERQAIARDLHDGLGQLLHVARVRLDALCERLPPSARASCDELIDVLENASRTTRSLTSQLSPPVLSQLGLPAALRWLSGEMDKEHGLRVTIDIGDRLPALSLEQSSILFRSARELLFNVVKHAGAPIATLRLAAADGELRLSVADAGVGLAHHATALAGTQGFGLASIRERLVYLGGAVEFAQGAAGGLRVTLKIPLTAQTDRTE